MNRRIAAIALIGWGLLSLSLPVHAQTVTAGEEHTVVVKPDGTVWAWGRNTNGQVGDGTTDERRSPVAVALTNVVAVAAGADHTLALRNDGTVWTWGYNASGQLGDMTETPRLSPVMVVGLANVTAIAAGRSHSLALTSDGAVWTWGLNTSGQLGDGTTTQALQPIMISAGWTATAIGAGHNQTFAIRPDGTLWAWGHNGSGRLGDGTTTTPRTSPVQVTGVSGAIAVAGGDCHSVVLTTSGVMTTGCNGSGQLGDGSTTSRTTMALVPSLANVTAVRAGDLFTSVLKSNGEVWSWGNNVQGQLGDNTDTSPRKSPVLTLLPTAVTVHSAGHRHGIAVSSAGVVYTWGDNGDGRLGDGTTIERQSPVAISDVNYQWKVATPAFSVGGGNFSTDQTVVITVAMAGAVIHYTTTGDDPTESDPIIASGGSIAVDRTMTLKARTWKDSMPPSNITAETYTMKVATPATAPGSGTYTYAQTVTVTTTTPGVTLRYTTDDSTPTESSPVYSAPLQIPTTTTLKVIGFRAGWASSTQRTSTYNMDFGVLAVPVISPAAGTYTSSVVVTLSALAGATIRYTTNGFNPNSASPEYEGPFTVSATQTVKAFASHPDYDPSPISTSVFTIAVATPVFSPGAGTYAPGQTVAITCDTPGATIRYTLDGSDPSDTAATIASGGTLVVGNYTLKAKAMKTDATTSAITAAAYQLSGSLTAPQVDGGAIRSILVRPDGLAWSWGWTAGNGSTVGSLMPYPMNITGVRSISSGDTHRLLAVADGSVYAWGSNGDGQLGDGTTTARTTPTRLTTIGDVVALSAGESHTLALKQDGTVWGWGTNSQGQLGSGPTVEELLPIQVPSLSGVTAIAAGEFFSLALKGDGTVWAWGDNQFGQLGDGSMNDRTQPAQIAGLTNVVAIAAGYGHAVALESNGIVWAWGYNLSGQLGIGSTLQQLSPVAIDGLPSITAVAAAGSHSLALANNGEMWAWGSNNHGQLGNGTTTEAHAPVTIAALSNILATGAGEGHSFAIRSDGVVWSWGANGDGEVGDGTKDTDRLLPVAISGPNYNWKAWPPLVTPDSNVYNVAQTAVITSQEPTATLHYTTNGAEPTESDPIIASGGTMPIDQSTTLKVNAWKPGAPTSETVVRTYDLEVQSPAIAPVSGSFTGPTTATITTPTAGATIRYTTDGTEPTSSSTVYSAPIAIAQTLTLKAAGYKLGWTSSDVTYASYFIVDGFTATPSITPAAGAYSEPQLVALSSATPDSTIRYTLDGSDPTDSSPLYRFPFLVSATTTVKARATKPGMNPSATATALYSLDAAGATATPTLVPAGGRFTVRQTVTVQASPSATLRYTVDGRDPCETDPLVGAERTIVVDRSQVLKVRAWQAGLTPSAVRGGFFVITGQVSAWYLHTLALQEGGTVWAWGYNGSGRLGNGNTTNQLSPVQIAITDVQAVAAGYAHSLALKRDGTVWAWGDNNCGQLGDNTTTDSWVPKQVPGLSGVVAIAAGGGDAGIDRSHSLALKADGSVVAWGCNHEGQLGDGTATTRKVPVQVIGLQGVTAILAGEFHSFAIAGTGTAAGVWAWGSNASKQLGDGTATSRPVPVRVSNLADVTEIATTAESGLALRRDGTIWTWGSGLISGLSPTPSPMPLLRRIIGLGTGPSSAFAIGAEGIRWAWGPESTPLGVPPYWGSSGHSSSVAGLGSNRVREGVPSTLQATGGRDHSVLLRSDGSVASTGESQYGQLGNGTTNSSAAFGVIPTFSLVSNEWLATDGDRDGLSAWHEWLAGTDPYRADTNGNGILDGIEDLTAPAVTSNPDTDGDGVINSIELIRGTDPFAADTDGDGSADGVDVFPLDPSRSSLPPPNPADTTPPLITLTEPTTARPVGGGG